MMSFTCFCRGCPLSLLTDLHEGSNHKGVFQGEPLKLDARKSSGDYEANQYWDTQQQRALVSFPTRGLTWVFLFTHNENDWLQTESGLPNLCKNPQNCIVLWWERRKNKVLLLNGKVNYCTCLLWQFHYLLHLSLLLSPGVLLLCTLLSTVPSFLSKHITTFMGIIRVQFMFLLPSSSLSGTDYKNNTFMLLGVGAALT